MGVMVSDYSMALIHPTKRAKQEILILAGKEWQGTAAIFAAFRLKLMKINVSVYIHESQVRGEEEVGFINAGGTVYRNLKDLQGRKFRVVVIGLENQLSRRSTILPLFGDILQHSVAVFVDPPVLKGSYSNALQYACRGTYNISQKTVIFVPNFPKTYVMDNFVDVFVVDVGIIPEIHMACGMEPFNFRQKANQNSTVQLVIPQKFNDKGSKIYFYNTEGTQVP